MSLALIAGQGGVPPHLVRVLLAGGEVPVLCEVEQFPSQIAGDLPRLGFRLETFGSLLDTLRARGVTRLCMAGAMQRPAVDPARIDAATAPLVPRLSAAMAKGDDGTLREIVAIIEEAGIAVIGAAEIAPDLLPEAGVLAGALHPDVRAAMPAAGAALAEMGRADAGQALVMRGTTVIAREDARGTDAMLDDLAQGDDWTLDPFDIADRALGSAADWLSGGAGAPDAPAFLYKAPKPGQEMRVDMPVIGPDTARAPPRRAVGHRHRGGRGHGARPRAGDRGAGGRGDVPVGARHGPRRRGAGVKAFLVAGEASGDRLGGALMAGLRALAAPHFAGIGGPMMQAQGLQSLFPMDDLSVMGLAEVLPRYLHLRRRLRETVAAVLDAAPDVLITIDSPDFCLRVARQVRSINPAIRTVHYVAPSVWAWRAGRAAKMARHVDQVLALLPFEPPLMEAAGMECDFVGHPVVAEPHPDAGEVAAFRARHGLGDAPLCWCCPARAGAR